MEEIKGYCKDCKYNIPDVRCDYHNNFIDDPLFYCAGFESKERVGGFCGFGEAFYEFKQELRNLGLIDKDGKLVPLDQAERLNRE